MDRACGVELAGRRRPGSRQQPLGDVRLKLPSELVQAIKFKGTVWAQACMRVDCPPLNVQSFGLGLGDR
jgi:hypothetical protein